jgi:transposase
MIPPERNNSMNKRYENDDLNRGEQAMAKKYRVTLTDSEREKLQALVKKRDPKALQVKRAYMLLAADELGEKRWPDEQIRSTYGVSLRNIERLRQRWVEDGLDGALQGKKREVFKEKVFDGAVEARLIALRCSDPPAGRVRWTLHLLADQMVALEYVDIISHESVRQILKKTRSSPGRSSPG